MTHWKMKLVVAMAAAFLLAAAPSTASDTGQTGLSPQAVLTRVQAAYAALSSYSEDVERKGETITSDGRVTALDATVKVRLSRPNFYRIEWHLGARFAN